MHKELLNAARLKIRIIPQGPLLVKAGGMDIKKPTDMQWVRTRHPQTGEETVYIPGSSLKGVLRSYAERLLRSRGVKACDPTEPKEDKPNLPKSCGANLQKKDPPHKKYNNSCPACRTFGNTELRGRLGVSDAYPADPKAVKIETRYGVAISRTKQSVAHGPFDMEVAVSGEFKAEVTLQNYELWQLGLLAACFEAMNDGWLTVGFGKNRGFGRVRVCVDELTIEQQSEDALQGIAAVRESLVEQYELWEKDRESAQVPLAESPQSKANTAFGVRLVWRGEAAWKVLQSTTQSLSALWSGAK